jgi:hypothetical protein
MLEKHGVVRLPLDRDIAAHWEKLFDQWRSSFGFELPSTHGIYKNNGIGQTQFMYEARKYYFDLFSLIYGTNQLACSLDGACYYPPDSSPNQRSWLHRDLRPQDVTTRCYQAVIDLIPTAGGLVTQKGSHHIDTSEFTHDKDWWKIPEQFSQSEDWVTWLTYSPCITIWDSRTFHMNQPSHRKALYVSALPITNRMRSSPWQCARYKLIDQGHTTSHWASSNTKNPESNWRSPTYSCSPNLVLGKIRSPICYWVTQEDLQCVGVTSDTVIVVEDD